jgi:16S rRNA (guanine527-N7)-methyltransferase
MNQTEIENFLAKGLDLMGLHSHNLPEVLSRLALYFYELKKWNQKINLIARTMNDEQILENHFLDSLTLLSFFDHENLEQEAVLDVGTGAGFPGLVLKAACPGLQVVLIEPRSNRYYFLKHIVRKIDSQGVELLNCRIEENSELQEFSGRKFSFITSRAFRDSSQFVRLVSTYLSPGGRIVCMKGPGAENELDTLIEKGLPEKFYVSETTKLLLPFSKAERALIFIKHSDEKIL